MARVLAGDKAVEARVALADRRSKKMHARLTIDMISNLNRTAQRTLYNNRATLARFVWAMTVTSNPTLAGMVVGGLGGIQKPVSLRSGHKLRDAVLQSNPQQVDAIMSIALAEQIPNIHFKIADLILGLKGYIEARRKRPGRLRRLLGGGKRPKKTD
ncbi:MAG: hypothetical protein J4203_01730 [Candidatus Diapherotrites archaeon]|uniref:Uncharacterized protein n=1 Tax=Candidatus Iainarchaeum sp. TaxID=3101447 RepID=A0A8T4LAH0_9ARCH|nr:hypothetical protein [Candidatus Diapherotrites archaeon]